MRLLKSKSTNACSYYMIESYRDEKGISRSRKVESLGTAKSIMEKYNVTDPEAWCLEYIAKKNAELTAIKATTQRKMTVSFSENKAKPDNSQMYNAGYLILDAIYHRLGFSNIAAELQAKHPHITGFSIDNVLRTLLFGRIINPSSKRRLANKEQQKFVGLNDVELQHIYRTMDIICKEQTLFQHRLYQYSSQAIKRDVGCIYYDCTNFYSEIEQEDIDVKQKSSTWYEQHTLRKYGKSKENRPNPIVQMGLFMDGNGMPLSFCIEPGNTNEQTTLIPLEKETIKDFNKSDIIVCTDCGLSSAANKKFNNVDESNNILVKNGLLGKRKFITVQSLKKSTEFIKKWAIDASGWSYSKYDAKTRSRTIVSDFNLNDIDDTNYSELYNTVFFKERTIVEQEIDQRLIVTFSIKYQEYLRNLRGNKIKRAEKMIANGTCNKESANSPKKFLKTEFATSAGEVATKQITVIDTDLIESDAAFDGFYAVTTNIVQDEMSASEISCINSRRWEIEECFRIMKSDLVARPFFHNKDSRIIAHFLTCFSALVICRAVEFELNKYRKSNTKYPYSSFTMTELLDALKEISVYEINEGKGYIPTYKNSEIITDLLELFDMTTLSKEIVFHDNMKKIFKNVCKAPKMIKKQVTKKSS